MTVIFHYHRVKGVITSGIIFSVLLLNTTCSFVLLLDILLYNSSMYSEPETNNIYRIFLCNFCLFVLSCFTDDSVEAGLKPNEDDKNLLDEIGTKNKTTEDNEADISPKLSSSFISNITFYWYTKLVKKAFKRELKINEIYNLEDGMKTNTVVEEFNKQFYKEVNHIEKLNEKLNTKRKFDSISLLKVIWRTCGFQLLIIILLRTIGDIAGFLTPVLLYLVMDFIKSDQPKWHGVFFIIGFILSTLLNSIFTNLVNLNSFEVAINLRTSLSNLVFYKAVRLSPKARKATTVGQITNLFQIDSARFSSYATYFVYIWSTPFQIIIAFSLLYLLVGNATFITILVISLIMASQYFLNRYRNKYISLEMKSNDGRIMQINEVLSGIKIIKLYAWENAFISKITNERNKQAYYIKLIYYLNMVVNWIFFSFSPMITLTTTIAVYIFLIDGTQFSAQKAFVLISIFSILAYPIEQLPTLISYYFNCKVSIKRLSTFFCQDELEKYVNRVSDNKLALTIKNKARFTWMSKDEKDEIKIEESNGIKKSDLDNKEIKTFELKEIELEVNKGSFVAVIGSVGSGKSSLISAIQGEMHLVENDEGVKGEVNISDDQEICYVAQQAWIQNNSFKMNILFGKSFDEGKYREVINACALEPDLKQFEAYDETEIGEKGINLSGGQKQRVSLARACYSSLLAGNNKKIILLDDPLSAVDAHVSKLLCDNVLNSKTGILKDTTRILVTNQLNQLSDLNVDQIILLKDGKIEFKCSYDELMKMEKNGELDEYDLKLTQNESKDEDEDKKSIKSDNQKSEENSKTDKSKLNSKLIEKEKQEEGKVNLKNYLTYLKNFGIFYAFGGLILMIGENCFQIYSRVYLSEWTNTKLNATDAEIVKVNNRNHLLVFAGLASIECLLNIAANVFIIFGFLSTVKLFHENLLYKILRSPISFFDTTPLGMLVQFNKK